MHISALTWLVLVSLALGLASAAYGWHRDRSAHDAATFLYFLLFGLFFLGSDLGWPQPVKATLATGSVPVALLSLFLSVRRRARTKPQT